MVKKNVYQTDYKGYKGYLTPRQKENCTKLSIKKKIFHFHFLCILAIISKSEEEEKKWGAFARYTVDHHHIYIELLSQITKQRNYYQIRQ